MNTCCNFTVILLQSIKKFEHFTVPKRSQLKKFEQFSASFLLLFYFIKKSKENILKGHETLSKYIRREKTRQPLSKQTECEGNLLRFYI